MVKQKEKWSGVIRPSAGLVRLLRTEASSFFFCPFSEGFAPPGKSAPSAVREGAGEEVVRLRGRAGEIGRAHV